MATAKHKTLGDNVIPSNYTLRFEPNLKTFRFSASAAIAVEIKKPTNSIRLNAKELEIHDAKLTSRGKIQKCSVSENRKEEEITLKFVDKIYGKAIISIEFEGVHNDQMNGFYRSKYTHNGKDDYIVTTQFEAVSARKAFPCIDEPGFKSTFDVTLVIDKELSAISNMPVKVSKAVNPTKKSVTFYTTPRMSTYLLYLGAGRYEYKSGNLGKLPIRIVTVPGKGKLAGLALEYTKKFVKYFEGYFSIKYQLPKLDMLAIPDFAAGAMENWGAITFRETELLDDPKNSAVMVRRRVAEVIAHELAHQWFGDLVTMRWWDDLWLNESFATFMSYKAMDEVYPSWEVDRRYILETISPALAADQLKTTHPINVPVNNPGEITSIFDTISYQKGGSILTMIEDYVGQATFRQGLHEYLKKHSYSNATKYDLWDSIGAAARRKGGNLNLKSVIKSWIEDSGYPIIRVSKSTDGMKLEQERYLLVNTKRFDQKWSVPMHYMLPTGKSDFTVFDKKAINLNAKADFVKLNYGQKGFYRTQYDPAILEKLGGLIKNGKMPPIDAWGIENDAYAMSRSGREKIIDYVNFVESFCFDGAYPMDISISGHLSGISMLLEGRLRITELREANLKYHRMVLKRLGWDYRDGERDALTMLRNSAITALGSSGDSSVIAEARKRFSNFVNNGKPIDPNIRGAIFYVNAFNGDKAMHTKFIELYHKLDDLNDKRRAMRALASFNDPDLLKRSLEFSLSDDVRLQDKWLIPTIACAQPAAKAVLWAWTRTNWKMLMKLFNEGANMLDRYVENLSMIDTKEGKREMIKFFSKKENMRDDIKKSYVQTLEYIDSVIRLIEANK